MALETGKGTQTTDSGRKGTAGGTKPAQFCLSWQPGEPQGLRPRFVSVCLLSAPFLGIWAFRSITVRLRSSTTESVKTADEPVPPSPSPSSPNSSEKKKQKAAQRLKDSPGGACCAGLGLRGQGPASEKQKVSPPCATSFIMLWFAFVPLKSETRD